MPQKDTQRLGATDLDERIRLAVELANSTPGMRIRIHGLRERYVLDWARRHDNRYVQVTAHGNDPADAACSTVAMQTRGADVILMAAPGPYARQRTLDGMDEASIVRRDQQDLAA